MGEPCAQPQLALAWTCGECDHGKRTDKTPAGYRTCTQSVVWRHVSEYGECIFNPVRFIARGDLPF